MTEFIQVRLEDFLDFIKSVEKLFEVYRDEDASAITIEITGYQNTGDIFFLDGDII